MRHTPPDVSRSDYPRADDGPGDGAYLGVQGGIIITDTQDSIDLEVGTESRTAAKRFCGGAMLDLEARQITLRTKPIGLSRLECRTLAALFEAQGQIIGAEVLFAAVWPETTFSASNLRALIGRLRQKLEPGCIETIGREGYAWVGRSATPPISRIRH